MHSIHRLARRKRARVRLHIEPLEPRSLLAVEPISLAGAAFDGATANGYSNSPSFSSDGQTIAFGSTASNLTTHDTNGFLNDVYVRDQNTGVVSQVSVATDGITSGNAASDSPIVSGDGRYVLFRSGATNLVSPTITHSYQLYRRDLANQTTALVTVNKNGAESGNGYVSNATISADGRYVAFESNSSDLVANITKSGSGTDLYVRDMVAGVTTLVSVNVAGTGTGNGVSTNPVISGNGRFVTFRSAASDLVANDGNKAADVFVRDLENGTTSIVSVNRFGTGGGDADSGNGNGYTNFISPSLAITPDGRYIAFPSKADDLVANQGTHAGGIYVRDTQVGTTTLVNVNMSGTGASDWSTPEFDFFTITPDGRYVAFLNASTDLAPNNGKRIGSIQDVYVRDLTNKTTTLITTSLDGTSGGNAQSFQPFISDDGRYVAFQSNATNLVAGDTNQAGDVFVRDTKTNTTSFVSVNASGNGSGNGPSPTDRFGIYKNGYTLSPNGKYVAFDSAATDLVANDNNRADDLFLRDLTSKTTILATPRSTDIPAAHMANGNSTEESISADGRYVAYASTATDIVGNDFNYPDSDIFVRDRQTNTNILVSVNSDGTATADNSSSTPMISADGRYVFFQSGADNLVANPLPNPNFVKNIYRRDLQTNTTIQVTKSWDGKGSPNGSIWYPSISPDGQFLVFSSSGTNLVAGVTVGHANSLYGDVYETNIASGVTTLVSVDPTNKLGANADAIQPVVSADGETVVFQTSASNLVAGDGPNTDVFARDLKTGITKKLSSKPGSTSESSSLGMSTDARYILFASDSTDLDPLVQDKNSFRDLFVIDRTTGVITLVSVNSTGDASAQIGASEGAISADGRYVAFTSYSSDLVPGGTVLFPNVFVRDLQQKHTTLVSVGAAGTDVSGFDAAISADGSTIAFSSVSKNVVPGYVNNGANSDLYVRKIAAGTTQLVTASYAGSGGGDTWQATNIQLSSDGSIVAFISSARNLYAGDGNNLPDVFVSRTVAGSGSISGQIFEDLNGDGKRTPGEPGLAGRTVFLDSNGDGKLSSGEVTRLTDATGHFSFTGLTAGTYSVVQVLPSGFLQTLPAASGNDVVTLATDSSTATGNDFGDRHVYADLVVNSLATPATGRAGTSITVTWVDKNQGEYAASNWQDAVYLSTDRTLDAADILLGIVGHEPLLGPGGTDSRSLSVDLPGLPARGYYVIVQADRRGQVDEGTLEANNVTASASSLDLTIPSLALGGASDDGFTSAGQSRYYQVSGVAGTSMLIQVQSAATSGTLDLFVRYGDLATPYDRDFEAFVAGDPNPFVVIPTIRVGTYSILVRAEAGTAAASNFSISASLPGLAVAQVSPGVGGNTGQVTLRIEGTNLSPNAQVTLERPGTSIAALNLDYRSSSLAFATFDLTGKPIGTYDVKLIDGGSTATRPGGFQVVAGKVGRLQVHLSTPAYARDNRPGVVTIDYTNTSNVDMAAPLFTLNATDAVFRAASGASSLTASTITVLGVSNDGPAGILPAGQSGVVYVNLTSTTTARHERIGVDLTVPEDPAEPVPVSWSTQKDQLRPPTIAPDAWDAIWGNFLPLVGNTIGDFHQAIAGSASYLSQWGSVFPDTNSLVGYLVSQANDSLPIPILASAVDTVVDSVNDANLVFSRAFVQSISGRYRLGPLGRGWVGSWEISLSTDAEGNVAIDNAGTMRAFTRGSDGSFAGAPGESGVLSDVGGVYQLREVSGQVLRFRADGSLDSVVDPSGNTIAATYTGSLLTRLSASDGGSISFAYNGQGRLTSVTDSLGHVITYTYDSANQHLFEVSGPSGTTRYSYVSGQGAASEHAIGSIAFPDGTHQNFSYDSRGRLIKQGGDGDNESITYAYKGNGVFTVTDAGGATTQYFVDDSNRVMEVINAAGLATRFTRDFAGNMTQQIDATGLIQSYDYDNLNHPLSVTDQLGHTTQFGYDPISGQTSRMVDAKGNTTQYTFDAQGNQTATVYADGSHTGQTFDAHGLATSFTNARGQTIGVTYDTAGRITSKTFPDHSQVTYSYDARGNLTVATDGTGTTTLEYSASDDLTKITYPGGRFIQLAYDAAGRRTRMNENGFVTNYSYDAKGRLTSLTDGAGQAVATYTYDALNRPTRLTRGNGTYTTYAYDGLSHLTSLVNHAPGGSLNSMYAYTYDNLGRVATLTTNDGKTTYSYDATGQLVAADLPGNRTITYAYDAAGNRTQVTDGGTATPYAANNLNEYTSAGSSSFAYDADGNLIRRTDSTGTTTYAYDAENRLTQVAGPAGSWAYQYNAFGARTSVTRNGQRTDYLFDPSNQGTSVAEFASDGSVIAHYTEGFGIVSRVADTNADYYDFDGIGSTAGLTGSLGSYVNQYSYLPFGETTTLSAGVENPYTFIGQLGVMNDGSGLLNMRARSYDPRTGQFASNDPLGPLGGDTNIRRYAFNNPVSITDPSGLGYFVGNGAYGIGEASPASFANGNAIELGHTSYITDDGQIYQFAIDDYAYRAPFNGDPIVVPSNWVPPSGNLKPGTKLVPRDPQHPPGKNERPPIILDPTHYNDDLVKKVWKRNLKSSLYSMIPFNWNGEINFENCHSFAQRVHRDVENIIAGDPNEIVGPGGFGVQRSIDAGAELPYTIHFENDPKIATAPAQDVLVTEQLDSDLDWSTFTLGAISFGSAAIAVPQGVASFATRFAYHNQDGSPLRVDVSAGLNLQTGVVTWTFHSIDPATGTFPLDPFAGFLPTNDATLRGQASLAYAVRAKPGLPTGRKIDASASIVFDLNSAIATNTHSNTVDAGEPSSLVAALPAITHSDSIPLAWSGADEAGGAGIATYDILVSTDSGPFVPFLVATSATSATFSGAYGHTYSFMSIATDGVGHVQAAPAGAPATTYLDLPVQVRFSSATYQVAESAGSLVVALTRSGGLLGAVTVNVSASGGTAVNGTNYRFDSTPVTFAEGQTSQKVTIPIVRDGQYAPGKTIGLVINGSGITPARSTITIQESDPPPLTMTGVRAAQISVKGQKVAVLVLSFSGQLDAKTASAVANYRLFGAGKDKKFGTKDDVVTKLASATYDPAKRTVTLRTKSKLVITSTLQLRVTSGGVRDTRQQALDGNRDNRPGGNAFALIGKTRVQLLSGENTGKVAPLLRSDAVDRVLEAGLTSLK